MENAEAAEGVERVQLRIPAPLGHRIQALIDEPSLGFTSLEHYLAAALHSFTSYKERQVERLKGDTKW